MARRKGGGEEKGGRGRGAEERVKGMDHWEKGNVTYVAHGKHRPVKEEQDTADEEEAACFDRSVIVLLSHPFFSRNVCMIQSDLAKVRNARRQRSMIGNRWTHYYARRPPLRRSI